MKGGTLEQYNATESSFQSAHFLQQIDVCHLETGKARVLKNRPQKQFSVLLKASKTVESPIVALSLSPLLLMAFKLLNNYWGCWQADGLNK